MSRTHRGNIKLDIEKLERSEAKLTRRANELAAAIGKTQQILKILRTKYAEVQGA